LRVVARLPNVDNSQATHQLVLTGVSQQPRTRYYAVWYWRARLRCRRRQLSAASAEESGNWQTPSCGSEPEREGHPARSHYAKIGRLRCGGSEL